jgi:hypothetical protein
MVVCPVAIAVGCRKCPVFGVCPLKSVIGDYKPDAPPAAPPVDKADAASPSDRGNPKRKSGANRKGARARRPRK